MPALRADQEHFPVPESAWSADIPSSLLALAGPVACSVIDGPLAASPGGPLPVTFTPALLACEGRFLPAGGILFVPGAICTTIGDPLGSPLPRRVLIELRRPGDARLFQHKGRIAGGSPYRVSALYVLDPLTSGLPVRVTLENMLHAFLAIFRFYSASGSTALLLHPLGGDAATTGLLAAFDLTATQLAAGCLLADTLYVLRSGLLGIGVRGASAFNSAGLMRRSA